MTRTVRTASAAPARAEKGARAFDWLFALLSGWFVGGLYLDGWAHTHLASSLESFFTPWHAVLYGGFFACFLALLVPAALERPQVRSWREAVPRGYWPSLVGGLVFLAGGVFDLTWHELFGIEQSISALLSPSHLTLAVGLALIVTGPLRAAASRPKLDVPALLSLGYVLALIAFFTQYAHPVIHPVASRFTDEDAQAYGIISLLLQSAVLSGAALFAVSRWAVPFGAFTLLFALNLLLTAALTWQPNLPALAGFSLLLGLLTDGLYAWLRPNPDRPAALRAFALGVPALFSGGYFLGLAVTGGVFWNVNLWLGSIVLSALAGVLLCQLTAPGESAKG